MQQDIAIQNSKSGAEMAQKNSVGRLSKTHRDYWYSRLFKRTYQHQGKTVEVADWYARFQFKGRREIINLQSSNRATAAETAKNAYISLLANGWDVILKKFKPQPAPKVAEPTVGDLIEQVRTSSDIRLETVENYAQKLRALAAAVAGIPAGRERYDYRQKGCFKWRALVHAVKLSRLTPTAIQAWKLRYIRQRGTDPLATRQAKNSVNTIIRNAKALFSPKALRFTNIELPKPHPFEGVDFEKTGSSHYRSEIHPELLMSYAQSELQDAQPEAFKILLLALGVGLRLAEIDTLTWEQVDFTKNVIRVETNVYTSTKSSESEAAVDVDPGLMDALLCFKNAATSHFVVNSGAQPLPTPTYHHYRCTRHFEKLIAWLRKKGIRANNPIHTLRKEFGSLVCQQYGLYAASRQLRHADIRMTREYYVDKKQSYPVKIALLPAQIQRKVG